MAVILNGCLLNVCHGKHIFIIPLEDRILYVQEEFRHNISFSVEMGHYSILELAEEKRSESFHSHGYDERTLFMVYLKTASGVNYVTLTKETESLMNCIRVKNSHGTKHSHVMQTGIC
jgi:hypothetical protein